MKMDYDTTVKIASLILKVFGLPTGLFSIVTDTISIGKKVKNQNTLSKKQQFISKLHSNLESITWNENNFEDVREKVMITLADEKYFSAKRVLHYYNKHRDYSNDLTNELFGKIANTDPSAEGYRRAMEQIMQSVYTSLPLLEIATDVDIAILEKLFSYEKLSQDNNEMLKTLQYKGTFAEYIDKAALLRSLEKKDNVFSYRSSQIKFYGRERELDRLDYFLKQPNISIWGIAGPGGCGKSKLARYLATKERHNRKTVWLNQNVLDNLCGCPECNYPFPILFVCDYASQFEEPLINLVQLLSTKPIDAKILLLERQPAWYTNFINSDEAKDLNEFAYLKEPLDLTNADLFDDESKADEVYSKIIKDLANSEHPSSKDPNRMEKNYKKTELNDSECDKIIQRAKRLSAKKQPIRCLFLLLVADAYLNGEKKLRNINREKLLKSYFERSKRIISKRHNDKKKTITESGYRVLAFATAQNGIQWEQDEWNQENSGIDKDLECIFTFFAEDPEKINGFYSGLSETPEKNTVSPLKPDLIGEFLFLEEWNNHLVEKRKGIWFSKLFKQDQGRSFFSRCIANWGDTEAKKLYKRLTDLKMTLGSAECVYYADVLYKAICEANSEEERKIYLTEIKDLLVKKPSLKYSKEYIDILKKAVSYRVEHTLGDNNEVEYEKAQQNTPGNFQSEAEEEMI